MAKLPLVLRKIYTHEQITELCNYYSGLLPNIFTYMTHFHLQNDMQYLINLLHFQSTVVILCSTSFNTEEFRSYVLHIFLAISREYISKRNKHIGLHAYVLSVRYELIP